MILDQLSQSDLEEEVYIFPASFAQQRLWFIEQLVPDAILYSIPLVLRLNGSLQRSHLHQSLQTLTHRHESLRTTLEVLDGQLMQIVATEQPIYLDVTDLRSVPASLREDQVQAQIWQTIQQPFCLSQGPLWRVHVWQLQDQEHLLLITLHHIIFDEWSTSILVRELGQIYTAILTGQPIPLPELPIQYADFAHWQRAWLQGDALNAQLRYWKQQLKDVPTLELPGVGVRSVGQNQQGGSELLELPQTLLDALEALSQEAGTTLFMTLLAGFQTLLHRYTGQTDLAIGSPIANRHRSELEGLIGFLVNSLVLRTDLAGNLTFLQLLERVRDTTLAAYDHQDLPFEKLVEVLQPLRSLNQNPLFQVVFALQNTPMEQLVLPGLVISPVELETKTARFDLEVYVWKCADNFRNLWGHGWKQSDGLRGIIVYNSDLFTAETIAAFKQHFHTLLSGIVANPQARLADLPLLTLQEQQSLVEDWQSKAADYAGDDCIHHLFEAQAQQHPEAIALQFGPQQFTYQALNQGSNQLARHLKRLGITSDMPVGICLERGVEAIAAMLAILKAGGAYVPLDPTYPSERLRQLIQGAGITVVLTQVPWVEALPGDVQVLCLDQDWKLIAQESPDNLRLPSHADQLAYVIYTSGSTGTPKGVMVPHRAVCRLVQEPDYVQIDAGDRIAQVANLAFDAATFEVWGALLNGARLVGLDRDVTLSPPDFAAALRQEQITILFLTTALLHQTVNQNPTAFQSLKTLLFGGETANVDCIRSLVHQGKPQHLIHVYGPTENTTFSTWYEVQEIPERATTLPIGRAIAHTQVYLLDANRVPVPPGVTGEIYLGGAGLARGYLHRPELTAERFLPPQGLLPARLYRTGDRARFRPDGELEFLGRSDRQVKLRGYRVELGEIEMVLTRHPQVQTAVVRVRDLAGLSQMIAYVVASGDPLTERELLAFLKTQLPAYLVPAAIVVLAALPLTANGKVDLKALPLPETVVAGDLVLVAPTNSLEASLVQTWSQLLGRNPVGIHDNFFELGGHSLLATQLVSRIRDQFQVELPLRQIFETPTVAELAQSIATLRPMTSQEMEL